MLIVRKSPVHGLGLFTTEPIAEGSILGYFETVESEVEGPYTIWFDEMPYDVIGTFKYINHHDKPNIIYYNDKSIVAIRNIASGEELLHDYNVEEVS